MMTACASSPKHAAGPNAESGPATAPQASLIQQRIQNLAAAEPAARLETANINNAGEAQTKGTDTLMGGSADLATSHQTADPLQCLLAWGQNNQKNNPYLKTCEASPPRN